MEFFFSLALIYLVVHFFLIQKRISDLDEKVSVMIDQHWEILKALVSEQAETLIDNSRFRQWELKRHRRISEQQSKENETGGKSNV